MMKAHPDINDTLRDEGPDAVRARHDQAHKDKAKRSDHDNSGGIEPPQDTEQPARKQRFPLRAFADIMMSTTPNYLVKGVIPRAGLAVIWGAPKCGKSFWTFDLFMHVALGRPYRKRRVQQG